MAGKVTVRVSGANPSNSHIPIFELDDAFVHAASSSSASSRAGVHYGYCLQPKIRTVFESKNPSSSRALLFVKSDESKGKKAIGADRKLYLVRPPKKSGIDALAGTSALPLNERVEKVNQILKSLENHNDERIQSRGTKNAEEEEEEKDDGGESGNDDAQQEKQGDGDDDSPEEGDANDHSHSHAITAASTGNGSGKAKEEKEKKDIVCCICGSTEIVDPWISECSHICCGECWLTWLNENADHHCPECESSVDLEHLKKVSLCAICNRIPTDAWTSACKHSNCKDCWKTYLQESQDCPVCQASVDPKDVPD